MWVDPEEVPREPSEQPVGERADEWLAGDVSLDAEVSMPDGSSSYVRDILAHMVEEYARHAGHADPLRECIDGRTGQ